MLNGYSIRKSAEEVEIILQRLFTGDIRYLLVCMQILGVWKTATNVFYQLMGVLILIQTIKS